MRCTKESVAAALPFVQLVAADADYQSYASTAFDTLQQWYNQTSGIWDTMGWWNGANAMTTIGDLASIDSSILSQASDVFSHTYQVAPAVNPSNQVAKFATPDSVHTVYGTPPGKLGRRDMKKRADENGNAAGFVDTCYDDNGWWALAWTGAWDLTKNDAYLGTAKGIFDQMSGGGPTNCSNGGIIWCTPNATAGTSYYVNAIANELYLSVAAHLANRDPSNETFLDTAKKQWEWFQGSGMINSDNLINDGLDPDCSNNGNTVWSYNMGVILGGLVELDKATGGSGEYIDSAHTLAAAGIANLTDSNHILHDTCEPDTCEPDATQFKGVFMRNLQALHQASPKDEYKEVILANADSIWASDKNDQDQLSVVWSGPFVNPVNASTHSSAMDALVAAAAIS